MKISFIILTWNRYKFLEKCIENLITSISNQSQAEIIIMDNGSDDATSSVLEKYEQQQNIRIYKLKKNYGIAAYKKLFGKIRGEYAVIVDDDVLSFPKELDALFIDYMKTYTDFGFVGLNVIQNEFTDGAKPSMENYTDEIRGDKILEAGPTGGWCTCFRMKDYRRIKWRFLFSKINMKVGEDGKLSNLFHHKLHLKAGLIKNSYCFHACGPYYAKEYGHLDREIEKYSTSGLDEHVEKYKKYL